MNDTDKRYRDEHAERPAFTPPPPSDLAAQIENGCAAWNETMRSMAADQPVTPEEIEAAIDLLCSRGWSPPNAHGFATDIRDALIAARRRAPPVEAHPLALTPEGEADWQRRVADLQRQGAESARRIREDGTVYRATPPAAPATVTDLLRECRQFVNDHGPTQACWMPGGLGDRIDRAIAAASASQLEAR